MIPPRSNICASRRAGFTILEILVAIAVILVLAAISMQVSKNVREKANLARVTQKIRNLGEAFVGYTTDNGGLLPFENYSGSGDGWESANDPEAREVWYNALLEQMGYPTVGDLATDGNPDAFYDEQYPLYVPGAPYPKSEKKLKAPMFAIGMNSRLQRRDETGHKEQGTMASIQMPAQTVIFLERGMPGDQKVVPAQANFSASPKAGPKAFAGRHNQKGVLLFADGHSEVRSPSEIISPGGEVIKQTSVIWTRDPDDDPN